MICLIIPQGALHSKSLPTVRFVPVGEGVKQVDSCCGVPQGVRTMSTLISRRALRSDPTAVHTSRIPPRSTHRAPNSTGSQNTLVRGTCPRPIRTLQPSTSTKCTWPLGGGRGTTCSPWRRLLPYARPTRTPRPFSIRDNTTARD